MRYIIIFICLFTSILSFSQSDLLKRQAFDLIVKVDDEGFYQQKIEASPYFVADGILQIYPGEKIFIEVEIKENKITNLKAVNKIQYPEKTIEIEFKQSVDGKIHERMTLLVKNPFDRELKYSASMYILNHDKWIETSIIPVYPKLSGYEMWQDIILSLVLQDWELGNKS